MEIFIAILAAIPLWAALHELAHAAVAVPLGFRLVTITPTWTWYRKGGIVWPHVNWLSSPDSGLAHALVYLAPRGIDLVGTILIAFTNDLSTRVVLAGGVVDYVWGMFRSDTTNAARSIGINTQLLRVMLSCLLLSALVLVGRAVFPM